MILIIVACLFGTILAEAPYPARGWKPQGQPFNLPSRQIEQQYGAPVPFNQYLPQQDQPARNFAESNFALNRINTEYGTPENRNFPQQNGNRNQQFDPRHFENNFPNNQFGNLNPNQLQNQNSQFDFPRNEFGASNQNFQNVRRPFNNNNNEQDFNRQKNDQINQQSFNNNNDDERDDEGQFSVRQENFNGIDTTNRPEKKYITPTSTVRTATAKPRTINEQPDEDVDQPNVAVSKAVAGSDSNTGQYYILQPDGRLQRVIFMTTQEKGGNNNDGNSKNGAYIANLMYETVEPLKGPIYSYTVDNQLVRIN